ncbi:MAG TPA: efflux RND transporter periplasmic adaptor subunit [Syntrophorhabdaceae bacterium]|jgi:HlyD family secretion protein
MKKRIIIIVVILAVIGGAFLITGRLRDRKADGTMLLSGNVEVTEVNVGFKLPGRVVERLVDEGDQVKAGDLIARLDNKELASVVNQGKASLGEAAARLEELHAGSRSQEIEQAEAGVKTQRAELEKVKNDFARAEVLFRNGAIAASRYDAAKSAYEARAALYRNSMETLSLTREGPRKEEIRIGTHRVEQARASLAAAQERFKDTVIFAPTDGIVLRKNVEPGETVAQGIPIVTIGDLEKPWVKVYVKEDKIALIRPGQKASVTVDTYKNKAYEGVVSYISSEAEFTPKTVQTPEERVKLVFGVKVRVKNDHNELKPGMPADVRILLDPQSERTSKK